MLEQTNKQTNKQTKGYVINLNRSPDRLKRFFSQTSANLFTRMPAIDKQLLELFDLEIFFNTSLCESLIERKVTSGEIACTLSHIACWKEIANDDTLLDRDFAIIAEDDVLLKNDLQSSLQQVIDVFENGYFLNQENVDLIILQSLAFDWFNLDENFCPMYYEYNDSGSSLYLIRKSLAIELTEKLKKEKPYWLADRFTDFCDKERVRGVKPHLGYIVGGFDAPSDLESDRQRARCNT